MKRRLPWYLLGAGIFIAIGYGYFCAASGEWSVVPQPVAQEVAATVFAEYVSGAVLDPARYAFFVAVEDRRIDLARLIAATPVHPSARYFQKNATVALKLSRYEPVVADVDATRIITISEIKGRSNEARTFVNAYSSPVGSVTWYVVLKRRWWKWRVVEWRQTGPISYRAPVKRPNKAPEPTPGLGTSRAEMASEIVSSGKARLLPSPGVAVMRRL